LNISTTSHSLGSAKKVAEKSPQKYSTNSSEKKKGPGRPKKSLELSTEMKTSKRKNPDDDEAETPKRGNK
jgi:predicted transcriptional regulator